MLKARMNKGKTRISAGFLLAEMERFELSRRFEPTYRISSADPSTAWVHLRIFPPVFNSQKLLERKAGEKT